MKRQDKVELLDNLQEKVELLRKREEELQSVLCLDMGSSAYGDAVDGVFNLTVEVIAKLINSDIDTMYWHIYDNSFGANKRTLTIDPSEGVTSIHRIETNTDLIFYLEDLENASGK